MNAQEYEAKRQLKVEYLEGKADQAHAQAVALHTRAADMASVIPFGQPIHVGHYSEQRDRNYRGRIESTFRKSFEAHDKAEYYARRAASAASNRAIFSNDPAAGEKLEAKIERLEKQQELMKAANKAILKGNDETLRDLGFTDERIAQLKAPGQCGGQGFPSFRITNNGANIRRLKERLACVTTAQATPETQIEGSNARFEDCPSENRVRLFFPGKPSEEVRSRLKSVGFRWSPTIGAWQAYRHHGTIEQAKKEAGIVAAS